MIYPPILTQSLWQKWFQNSEIKIGIIKCLSFHICEIFDNVGLFWIYFLRLIFVLYIYLLFLVKARTCVCFVQNRKRVKKRDEKETNLPQSTLSTFADTLLKRDFGANSEKRVTAQYFYHDNWNFFPSFRNIARSELFLSTRTAAPLSFCSPSDGFSRFVLKQFHLQTDPPQYLPTAGRVFFSLVQRAYELTVFMVD